MRERRDDTGIAIGLSVGLHLLAALVMWLGWWFTPAPVAVSVAGPPIEVELVSAAQFRDRPRPAPAPPQSAPQPAEEAAPPPQPEPEPTPQDAMVEPQPAPQTPQAEPDVREQERASRDAVSPEPPAEREQEERRREEQVDLTEREEQQRVEERQRRAQQQMQRLERIRELQRQREAVAADSRMDQQRLEQLNDLRNRQPPTPEPPAAPSDAQATPMAGNNGVDTSLQAAYALAISQAIERQWRRPETIPVGQQCVIYIRQIPGGEVTNADVDASCPYDAIGRDSLERAVFAASPLPYAGFESVFNPRLRLRFTPQD